jgi:DNA replication protein DnaC
MSRHLSGSVIEVFGNSETVSLLFCRHNEITRAGLQEVPSEARGLSTDTKTSTGMGVLARDVRGAYSCRMARADCPHCEGSGWKVVERTTEGAQALAADRPGAGAGEAKMVWAVPCDCTTSDRSERALQRSRVPERYRHCDFENYETDNDIENVSREQMAAWNRSLGQAKLLVQKFAEEFTPVADVRTEHGLLLMGPCGVGKTHLAVSAMKSIVLRGHSGLFYDYRELLKAIQDSYNPESQATEMSVLEPVLKAEILVLDDVGSSKPSLWALETVGHVLNTRYNEKRVTLLTTNFLDSETGAGAGSSANGAPPTRVAGMRAPTIEDSLTERVGKRIRSRLYEMCRTVEINAADYRKEIRHAGPFR